MHSIGVVSLGFPEVPGKVTGRRASSLLAALLLLLLLPGSAAAQTPGCAPSSPNYPCAYVANSSADTLSVLGINNTVITTVQLAEGGGPSGVAITPNNSTVYVAEGSNGTLEVIDTATNSVTTTITLTANPTALAVTPNGSFVYVVEPGVVGQTASHIDVVSTSTNTISTTITSGLTLPTGIAIRPDGAFAYAADECPASTPTEACVDVINLSTNTVGSPILITGTSNSQPNSIAVSADGTSVYVTAVDATTGDVEICVIATSTNTVVVSGDTLDIGVFLASPYGFAIAPNQTLYLGIPSGTDSQREATVYALATSTNTLLSPITVGQDPTGLAVGASGGIVYVTNSFDGTVSIIGTGNNLVNLTPITVGTFPEGVAAMRVSPVPLINQPLVPSATAPGGAGFTLTVNGTGFASNASVLWNGAALTTQFVSQGQLKATVPAGDIASFGTASITATNAAPGGGNSNAIPFTVTASTNALTFATLTDNVGTTPVYVVTADFNKDGKPDLAVINQCGSDASCLTAGSVSILLGNGDGTFSAGTTLTTGLNAISAAVGDFNADGNPDLAVLLNDASNCDDGSTCPDVAIFLGNGNGTFTTGTTLSVESFDATPTQLITGDFNGDGKLDLAIAAGSSVYVYLGNGDGTFSFGSFPEVAGTATSLVTGDFNADGILDLAVAVESSPWVDILLGDGDGTFTLASSQPLVTLSTPSSLTTGDFNADGKLDLAITDGSTGILTVLLGNSDGTFTLKSGQPVASQDLVFATTADFNGDNKLDLALVGNGGLIFVDLGNGDGTFQASTGVGAGNGSDASAFGDFNADGRLDLAVANSSDNTVSILEQTGGVSLSTLTLSFGNQIINTTSSAQPVTLTNTGSAPLYFGPITVGAGFAQTNNCPSTGPALLLVAGAACTFQVTFTPTSLGAFNSTLSLSLNLPSSSVALSGTGTAAPPQIETQPANKTVNAGQTATLTVTAAGTAPLSYQWYQGQSGDTANPISGATSTSFTTPALQASTSYWVRVSNAGGSVNSNTATITVVIPVAITTQPLSQTINAGQTATLVVSATGTAPISYQWYQGTTGVTTNPISSATSASFTTPVLQVTTSYWVQVSNAAGAKNSQTATIAVVAIVGAPTCSSLTIGPGTTGLQITFTATCSATTVGTSINWGDNSAVTTGTTAAVSTTHTYAAIGTYSLTLTATSSSGQSGGPAFAQVTLVSASTPPPVFSGQSSDTPLMLTAPPNSTNNPVVKFECTTVTVVGGATESASDLGLECTSDPPTMTLTDTPQSVTISVQTSGTATELRAPVLKHMAPLYASWFAFPGLMFTGLWAGVASRRKNSLLRYLALGLLASLLIFAVSCGGGFTPPASSTTGGGSGSKQATPPGKYFVTVVDVPAQGSAPTGFVQTSLIVPLTVTGQ